MIADTAVLSTSPWHHDQLFRSMDLPGLEVDVMTMDETLDANLSARPRRHSSPGHELQLVDAAMGGTSSGGSIASSDCSEEPFVDIEGCVDQNSLFAMHDDMMLNVLSDSSYTASSLAGLGWSDSELECTVGDLEVEVVSDANSDILPRMPSISSHSQPTRKRRRSKGHGGHADRNWVEMGVSERLTEVEELTNIISSQMGLREQLEVIRIINPHASVLPTDTEFVIELEYLTDDKLREVREYVQKHVPGSCTSINNNNNNNMVSTQQKKHTKKQRRQEQKEQRQRQRREYRQTMKEKRSGLFKKEEVVSLSNHQPSEIEEEEDIDILT